MSLRRAMPLLARHEGVWEGYYRYYDAQRREDRMSTSRGCICRIK